MDAGELAAARVERPDDAAARQQTKQILAEVMSAPIVAESKKNRKMSKKRLGGYANYLDSSP